MCKDLKKARVTDRITIIHSKLNTLHARPLVGLKVHPLCQKEKKNLGTNDIIKTCPNLIHVLFQ